MKATADDVSLIRVVERILMKATADDVSLIRVVERIPMKATDGCRNVHSKITLGCVSMNYSFQNSVEFKFTDRMRFVFSPHIYLFD